MTDPIFFPGASPRFGLPMLFAGQAQKEVFVNEAHALTDALLHCAIEAQASTPPTAPVDGTNWLISPGADGEWSGHDGALACRQAGNWLFVSPVDGMRALDRSSGQSLIFINAWQIAGVPMEPIGGPVVDSEARTAILELIAALRMAAIFPTS
jgi:hypothetical protein